MKISVCITSFNQERYLGEAIDSVLAQTRPADEIILVDDASTDNSRELIRACAEQHGPRVAAHLLEHNLGAAGARNHGLQQAGGDLICFLDGDDRFLPAKLERESAALARYSSETLVYSNINYIGEDGDQRCRWAEAGGPPQGDVFLQVFARQFPRGNLFRNELVPLAAWRDTGLYDTRLGDLYEDFDMRIRLCNRLQAGYVDEPLTEYRLHDTGLSSVDNQQHYDALARILEKNMPLLVQRGQADTGRVLRSYRRLLARHVGRAARSSAGQGRLLQAARQGLRAVLLRLH